MQQSQNKETYVPIFLSQQEYDEVMKQPPHLQQQMMLQIFQKNQQSQPEYHQQHPYLTLQQQNQNQQQKLQDTSINIPPIPQQPDLHPYLRIQQQQQQQQQQIQYQQYTPQQQIYQQYQQNLNQPLIQQQETKKLEHKEITSAGELEAKYFNQRFVYLFTIQNLIAILVNFFSIEFYWRITTSYWNWNAGLYIVLSLFIVLNLFIITNPRLTLEGHNQKLLYVFHTVLFVLLMQGLQTATSGYCGLGRWDTNYFFYFYFQIVMGFVSVNAIVRYKGFSYNLKSCIPIIVLPQALWFTFLSTVILQYFYIGFFIWVLVVILISFGEILLIRRINKIGYNNFKTSDYYGMAAHFPTLLLSPFYDN